MQRNMISIPITELTVADLNCGLVANNPKFKSCQKEVGSHKQTFLMYVVVRMLWTIGDASVFNTMDTLSINLAEKYKGQYNTIFASVVVPGVLAPTVAGFLVKDYKDNPGFHFKLVQQCQSKRFLETCLISSSGHGDYRILFYTVFGCVVSSWLLAMLILDFNVKSPSAKRHRGGLSRVLFSRALLVYLTMFFFNGFIDGVRQSYVNVDLEDNLGASSKLLGILQNICKHLLGSC